MTNVFDGQPDALTAEREKVAALEAAVERLKAESGSERTAKAHVDMWLEVKAKLASLQAAADKLAEKLEPFANLGVTTGPDDEPCHYAYRITRGSIRNARAALTAYRAAMESGQ